MVPKAPADCPRCVIPSNNIAVDSGTPDDDSLDSVVSGLPNAVEVPQFDERVFPSLGADPPVVLICPSDGPVVPAAQPVCTYPC